MVEPQPPQQQPAGVVVTLIHAVKSMTLTQALVIIMLAVVAIPSYLLWHVVSDPVSLGRFLSSYEEQSSDKSPCTLKIASLRGAGDTYGISAGFAFQGSDKWVMSVIIENRKPTPEEFVSYCEALLLLIDFMRDPTKHPPPFPGTSEEIIHMYPDEP